jgi:hypothetical protein
MEAIALKMKILLFTAILGRHGEISGLYLFTGIRYNSLMSGWIVHLRKSDRSHEKLK